MVFLSNQSNFTIMDKYIEQIILQKRIMNVPMTVDEWKIYFRIDAQVEKFYYQIFK